MQWGSLDGEEKIRHNEQRYGFDPSTHPPLPDCRLCDVASVTYTLWASVFLFVKRWCPPHLLVSKNDRKWALTDCAPRRELPFAPLYPHLLNFQTRLMQLLFLKMLSAKVGLPRTEPGNASHSCLPSRLYPHKVYISFHEIHCEPVSPTLAWSFNFANCCICSLISPRWMPRLSCLSHLECLLEEIN